MPWPPFHHNKQSYDFSHLESKTVTFIVPASGKHPQLTVPVLFQYGDHCFTSEFKDGDDETLFYKEEIKNGKPVRRMFNVLRWELSLGLPALMEGMLATNRRIYFTHNSNFHILEIRTHNDLIVDYLIFLDPQRQDSRLRLYVQSAYPFDPDHGGSLPNYDEKAYAPAFLRNKFLGRSLNRPPR